MASPFRELGCFAKLCMMVLGCCAILGMPGCGGNGTTTPPGVTLTSISVTPMTPASIPVTGTIQFTATGNYSDGSTQDLTSTATWTSTDPNIASISSAGLATGLAQGSTVIKATQGTTFGESSSFSVTEPITAISISPLTPSVAAGIPQQFTATATYADMSTGDVTNLVTWSSDTPAVATISNVAAFNGVTSTFISGSATISASSGGVSATQNAVLTVNAPAPVGLVVSPQNPVIADAGGTQQFKALAQYSDGSTQDVTSSATWSSNNTNVAPVNAAGLVTSNALTSGTAGFASISASWTAPGSGGAVKKSKKVVSARTVKPQVSSGPTTLSGVSILSVTLHTGNGFAGTFTQHNDIYRTGQNINESYLNSTTVNSTNFGKLFSQPVDGYVFAQPLYVPNVNFAAKGTHNVVYVATENDSVYAYDADSNTGANDASPLWKASLIDTNHGSGNTAAPVVASGAGNNKPTDVSCGNIANQIGITSTPVIDPSTNTMYVEVESKEGTSGSYTYLQKLHAIDITTGAEKSGWPITITGTVPGTSDGSTTVAFVPIQHLSRPGLLLLNGTVFAAFSSNCDNTPYHGWVFSYNVSTGAQTGVYSTTANGNSKTGGLGGIWMSGCGIAGDSNGNIYLVSGNGDFDTVNTPAVNTGDSILKFNQRGPTLQLVDYFTPSDQNSIDSADLDQGSAGLSLLPDGIGSVAHPNLIAQAGKNGKIYLVDRDQLTAGNVHYCSTCTSDTDVVQELPTAIGGMWSMPAYWNNNVYFWGTGDGLMDYTLSSGLLSTAPAASSILTLGYPGSVPTVSASSATANGIVWAIDATSQPAGAAVLYAFDATKGLVELFKTQGIPADQAGPAVKFSIPTVANGKVYVGTQTEVDVYGKLP